MAPIKDGSRERGLIEPHRAFAHPTKDAGRLAYVVAITLWEGSLNGGISKASREGASPSGGRSSSRCRASSPSGRASPRHGRARRRQKACDGCARTQRGGRQGDKDRPRAFPQVTKIWRPAPLLSGSG